MTPAKWSSAMSDYPLVGPFERTGILFPTPIPNPEVAVMIQRNETEVRDVARRVITSPVPALVREAEEFWIEPSSKFQPGMTVERPVRQRDFRLEVRDRITMILCLAPQPGKLVTDEMMERIRRLARLEGGDPQFDGHLLLFGDGASIRYPGGNYDTFLDAMSLEVGSQIPHPEDQLASGGGPIERLRRWWKRKRR